MRRAASDFQLFGLGGPPLDVLGRNLVLTVDFEAFQPASLDLWLDAMSLWSDYSAAGSWRFSIFIALEDVVQLKHRSSHGYRAFLERAKKLSETGSVFYPHNHGIFD